MSPKLRKIFIIVESIVAVALILIALQIFTSVKPYTFVKGLVNEYIITGNYAAKNYHIDPKNFPTLHTGPPADKNLNIFIQNMKFNPNSGAITVGTKVTWYNQDSVAHAVTSDSWNSGLIPPGGTFSKTFDAAGKYEYRCTVHPDMKGELIVQ